MSCSRSEFSILTLVAGAVWVSVVATACTGSEQDADRCEPAIAAQSDLAAEVRLGVGTMDDFEQVADGGELELELGTQGGWMVRLMVQSDAETIGADENSCLTVEMTATVDGLGELPPIARVPEFIIDHNGSAISEPVIVLLAFDVVDVEGKPVTIKTTLTGPGGTAEHTLAAQLVNRE